MDPQALTAWLTSHNYNIPADIQPVIDAYVAESFDFLAIKLVPGNGVDSMKPVRVTTPGAGAVLPLRMVAAGTGVTTDIQLWVLGEGRYEPKNFPSFIIGAADITWNWDTQSSDYAQLVQAQFDKSKGFAWNLDYGAPTYPWNFQDPLQNEVLMQYADQMGMNAQQNLDVELLALYGGFDMNSMWLSHMYSSLSRPALASDLQLQASADQSALSNYLVAGKSKGIDPCGNTGGAGGMGGVGGAGANGGSGGTPGGNGDCNCAVPGSDGPGDLALAALGIGAVVAMTRRRRRPRS